MITRRQAWAVLALTLMWGVNWPMMKLSLGQMTPLFFRATTMTLGAAWLFVYVAQKGQRMWPSGREWAVIAALGLPNVLGWHTLSIIGLQDLASGRAAILGFTMPIFTVLLGVAFYRERLSPRVLLAVVCASLAIALLLWHELSSLAGRPQGVAWMIGAAFSWAWGTLMFRRAKLTLDPLVVTVWMLLMGSAVVWCLAALWEPLPQPGLFNTPMWLSLFYGIFINYGFAQIIWFGMARDLPPATSAMSIMAIPLVGTLSATVIVGEMPTWQDWAAMLFVCVAIASVLLPSKTPAATPA